MFSSFVFVLFFVDLRLVESNAIFVHETKVQIPAHDGILLNTLVFSPFELFHPSRVPTKLYRTPYGASNMKGHAEKVVRENNWVVIVQDLRGCHDSQGEFLMFTSSALDTNSTIRWILQQKWSDGTIFTDGSSALALAESVDSYVEGIQIAAQCITIGMGLMYEFTFQNGAFRGDVREWYQALFKEKADKLLDVVLQNEAFTPFWKPVELSGFSENVNWPSLFVSGWFDVFLEGSLGTFSLYKKANPHAYLVMSVGGHCTGRSALSFPNSSFPFDAMCSDMYHAVLKKEKLPPSFIDFYVMGPDSIPYGSPGGNFWVAMEDFPNSTTLELFFGPKGALSNISVTSPNTLSYSYDPTHPCPTIGGNNLFGSCGAQDLRSLEGRSDNVVWTSDVFSQPRALVGHISATLYVRSDRNDTDFVVRLSDVYPDGRSMFLRSGVVRMRWRNGREEPHLMTPGVLYEIEVDLWNTAYIVGVGHRLRVAVTSSSSPRYSVNRNNGLSVLEGGPFLGAQNSLSFGGSYPSRISISVVPIAVLNSHRI